MRAPAGLASNAAPGQPATAPLDARRDRGETGRSGTLVDREVSGDTPDQPIPHKWFCKELVLKGEPACLAPASGARGHASPAWRSAPLPAAWPDPQDCECPTFQAFQRSRD